MTAVDTRTAEAALLRLYSEKQLELEDSGAMPPFGPCRLERYRRHLEIGGAVNLGFLVACFTIFVLFIVLNLVFHVQFSAL